VSIGGGAAASVGSSSGFGGVPTCLPRPQHVVLNHLYAQRATAPPPHASTQPGGWGASAPLSGPGFAPSASSTPLAAAAVVVGETHRYRGKYVTTVFYAPRPRPRRPQQQQQPQSHQQQQQQQAVGGGGMPS